MWYVGSVLIGTVFSLILFSSSLPDAQIQELGYGKFIRFLIAMILLVLVAISAVIGFDSEYKRGQIDAIQGNVKYEMRQDTVWVKIN